jgi:hypothetical protein
MLTPISSSSSGEQKTHERRPLSRSPDEGVVFESPDKNKANSPSTTFAGSLLSAEKEQQENSKITPA